MVKKFQVDQECKKIFITDPCYDREIVDKESASHVLNPLPGTWYVYFENEYLVARHKDHYSFPVTYKGTIDVDSGQVGFFTSYPEDKTGDYNDKDSFYSKCCQALDKNNGIGEVDEGVVSYTIYGDGEYKVYTSLYDGYTTSIAVELKDEADEYY